MSLFYPLGFQKQIFLNDYLFFMSSMFFIVIFDGNVCMMIMLE